MRRLIFLFIIVGSCNVKEAKLDGAYLLASAQCGDSILSKEDITKHRTVKICKNGYWISATSFGNQQVSFEDGSGGTYRVKDGKHIETINFTSEEKLDSFKSYTFDFSLNADKYLRKGKVNSVKYGSCMLMEEYDKIPIDKNLQDSSLEGVWKIVTSEWFGRKNTEKDFAQIKIFSYPIFIWAQYKPEAMEFLGAGGGTYQYDGKILTEHMEYFSYYDITPGDHHIEITILPTGEMTQVDGGGAGKEKWKKIR